MSNLPANSDHNQTFKGRLYQENSGDFDVVAIRIEQQKLVITDGGNEKAYDLAEFQLDLTGQDGDKIRLVHVPTSIAIISTDRGLLPELQMHASKWDIGRDAKKAEKDLKAMPGKKFAFLGTLAAIIIGSCAAFYFGFEMCVNLAMNNIPPSAEVTIGELYTKSEKLDQNSEDYKRINRIGQKLVSKLKNSPYKFKFYVENKDEINAFALPGGTVIVLTKLIHDAKSDDEIACVIGHEIGHVIHRDTLRRLLHSGGLGLVVAIASGGMIDNEQINACLPLLQQLESLNYSRAQEAAADVTGIRITEGAGYNGEAIIDLFKRIEEQNGEQKFGKEALALLSDHPMSEDRIKTIKTEVAKARDMIKQGKLGELEHDLQ